jgi:hypothetical protein
MPPRNVAVGVHEEAPVTLLGRRSKLSAPVDLSEHVHPASTVRVTLQVSTDGGVTWRPCVSTDYVGNNVVQSDVLGYQAIVTNARGERVSPWEDAQFRSVMEVIGRATRISVGELASVIDEERQRP